MKEKEYYSIGQVSDICKVPIKTLRYYDEIKLLIPNVRKETSHYRYYSKEQLITAFIIRSYRFLGFSLKTIKTLVEQNTMDAYLEGIETHIENLKEEIRKLQTSCMETEYLLTRLKLGQTFLDMTDESGRTADIFKIEKIPTLQLLTARSVITSYHNEEVSIERWIEIQEEAIQKNIIISGPVFVTYHTDMCGQFFSKDCDVEFAIEVEPGEEKNEEVHSFGDFLAATVIHCGDYSDIFKSYISLKRWIDDNDYIVCGSVTEEFLISPVDTKNKEEHVTKIIVPVEKNKEKK